MGRAITSGFDVAGTVTQYLKDTGSRIFTMAALLEDKPPKVVS